MQCLRVYSQTLEQKYLWNALKYSTAFPLIYVGHLRGRSPSRTHDQIFVACAILQSSYTLVWDMVMDWGLAQQVN